MSPQHGRCRRQHQQQPHNNIRCEGPVAAGPCAKHAAEWAAYEKDRDARAARAAKEAAAKPRTKPRPDRKPWTGDEDNIIRDATTWRAAHKQLEGRTVEAVMKRRRDLDVVTRRFPWTDAERQVVRDYPLDEACRRLPDRPRSQVIAQRTRLGVSRESRPL